jgi:hypothetical protein
MTEQERWLQIRPKLLAALGQSVCPEAYTVSDKLLSLGREFLGLDSTQHESEPRTRECHRAPESPDSPKPLSES